MRMNHRIAVLVAILAAALAQVAVADKPVVLHELEVAQSVRAPLATTGVAIVDGHIWTIDPRAGGFLSIRPSDQKTIRTLASSVTAPRAVTSDGKALWTVGKEPNTLHRIDSETGRVLRTIQIPAEKTTSPTSIDALAWDGKFLWVGISAGWSSKILRVHGESGKVVQSFLADGIPRGLATDGKYLWMATFNGPHPAVLARWTITDKADEMSGTRIFVARLPGHDPTGLAFDRDALWYADRTQKTFRRLQLPAER